MVSGVGSVRMYVLTRPAELHVKTVKYFKSIERVQEEVEITQAELKKKINGIKETSVKPVESGNSTGPGVNETLN